MIVIFLYLFLIPIPVLGGLALYLKSPRPWLKVAGLVLFGLGLFGMLSIPLLMWTNLETVVTSLPR